MNLRSARFASISALALATVAGLAVIATPSTGQALDDQYSDWPQQIRLTGIVRDFRKYGSGNGAHPDFEQYNTGHRVGLVAPRLDQDGKPVLASTTGRPVNTQYRDSAGRNIMPSLYDRNRGDVAGSLGTTSSKAITSATTFAQWFRDVPGVNMSKNHTITLTRMPGTNIYTFHEQDDESTPQREGFFPVDGELWNDSDPTYQHNYHFTFELGTRFTYQRGKGQVFTFVGDDDVWVFINGQLAIDVGGVHGAVSQTIDLDRFADLYDLQDGGDYELKFFFAERHTTRSNCRIETNLHLRNAQLPTTSALFD
jgi:fibro-slime domain-containing protein